MQVAGSAYRASAADISNAMQRCPKLARALHRYARELNLQTLQLGTCNGLHGIDERLARWLLMLQDRLGGDVIPLTQEFHVHMLGTKWASVMVAAGILQKADLITYRRGVVTIKNRSKGCEQKTAIALSIAGCAPGSKRLPRGNKLLGSYGL
jgi:CRP-like cAMP-binding protein